MTDARAVVGIILDLVLCAVILGMGAWAQWHWSLRRQFQLHVMIPNGQVIGFNLPANWWMHTHGNEPLKIAITDTNAPPPGFPTQQLQPPQALPPAMVPQPPDGVVPLAPPPQSQPTAAVGISA